MGEDETMVEMVSISYYILVCRRLWLWKTEFGECLASQFQMVRNNKWYGDCVVHTAPNIVTYQPMAKNKREGS